MAEIMAVIVLMSSFGVYIALDDDDYKPYACSVKDDMFCHKLSKVNSAGIQTRCYYDSENTRKYKTCNTGWDEISIDEQQESVKQDFDTNSIRCDRFGCVEING